MAGRRFLSPRRFACVRQKPGFRSTQSGGWGIERYEIYDGDRPITVSQLVQTANRLEKHIQLLLKEINRQQENRFDPIDTRAVNGGDWTIF